MEGPNRKTLKLEEHIRSDIDKLFDQHPAPDALLILIGLFTFSLAAHLPPEWDKPTVEKIIEMLPVVRRQLDTIRETLVTAYQQEH
jgi:hypothetical protein